MEVAIGAIGIGIVLMVGYLVIAQVKTALLPTTVNTQIPNPCYGLSPSDPTYCNATTITWPPYGTVPGPLSDNTSTFITTANSGLASGLNSSTATVYAGFALIAVGIIVLAAFGLINIFK